MGDSLFPLIVIIIFIPVILSVSFIPYWTRKTESFGVTIPQKVYQDSELKKMRQQYAVRTTIFAILLFITLFIISRNASETVIGIQLAVIISSYLVISFLIYLQFHFQMKKLKQNRNWTQDKSERVFISTSF